MKHCKFLIVNNKVDEFEGEVAGTSEEYKLVEKSFGEEEIYYKITNGKISDIICEAFSERSAERAVSEYLNSLQF